MKDSLLEKCLHGKTQNVNEALNDLIWKRCPKDAFVSKNVIEIGVSSAVIHFNDGCTGIIPVLEKLGLTFGNMLLSSYKKRDLNRIKSMEVKTSTPVKRRRKKLRADRKRYSDEAKEK